MRDKLIELLENLEQEKELLPNERAADYLIANGVTFAEDNNVRSQRNIRPIDAYTLAEEIESLQITVGGKPAHWYDAKYTVLRMIAEQPDVPETNVGKWIPVSERLPEEQATVFVLCKNGAVFSGYRFHDYENAVRWRIHTALSSTKLLNKGRVTHWMPLPSTEGLNDT